MSAYVLIYPVLIASLVKKPNQDQRHTIAFESAR